MGIRVAVAGASGYAGGELLRLIAGHPEFDLMTITAHRRAGLPVAAVHPQLVGLDLVLGGTDPAALADADLVFLALPHGESAALAAPLPDIGQVVDLGADHRLPTPRPGPATTAVSMPARGPTAFPNCPASAAAITDANRVANTGCYAAAITLALAPLIAPVWRRPTTWSWLPPAAPRVLVGREGAPVGQRGDGRPVGLQGRRPPARTRDQAGHRRDRPVVHPGAGADAPRHPGHRDRHAGRRPAWPTRARRWPRPTTTSPSSRSCRRSVQPHTAATLGSNSCHLQSAIDVDSGRVIVTSAIDNLGKGAAGQAVQNANLVLGLPETDRAD